MKKVALIVGSWLALVGLIILDVGVPSSALGWGALIVLGPVGYLLLGAIGELGMGRLLAFAKRFGLGPAGRVGLLLLVLVPALVAIVYLANK